MPGPAYSGNSFERTAPAQKSLARQAQDGQAPLGGIPSSTDTCCPAGNKGGPN